MFLSNAGIASRGIVIILNSIQRYPKHFFSLTKRHIYDFLIANYAKSGKLKILDSEDTHIYAHYPWFNYYHWLIESIPRLVKYQEIHNQLTLLIPEQLYKQIFVRQTLDLFQFKNIEILPSTHHTFIKNLIIPKVNSFCHKYNGNDILITQKLFSRHYKIEEKVPFRKVYVSRKNALRRKFSNEEEVIKFLEKRGFEIHNFEDSSLEKQVMLLAETEIFISIHGAALSNILFMKPGTTVIEAYRKQRTWLDHKSKVYKNLALVLGLKHLEISCDSVDKADFFNSNLYLDISKLERKLEMLNHN